VKPEPPNPSSPPPAFGPYRVLHQIGAGALGPVFLASAEGQETGRVAIKAFQLDILPEQMTVLADGLTRLAARELSHPSIAGLLDAGVESGAVYLVQEYVLAESLDAAVRQYGPPPLDELLRLVTQMAGAIDFAAVAGVQHGGLHPRDVLVTAGDLRITGFGVLQVLESVGIRPPVRRPYTAPERLDEGRLARSSDIFSIGAIAYELLSGRRLTGAAEEPLRMEQPQGVDLDALREVFRRVLAPDPDSRYQKALDFSAGLHDCLGDLVISEVAAGRLGSSRPRGASREVREPTFAFDEPFEKAETEQEEPIEAASVPTSLGEEDDLSLERAAYRWEDDSSYEPAQESRQDSGEEFDAPLAAGPSPSPPRKPRTPVSDETADDVRVPDVPRALDPSRLQRGEYQQRSAGVSRGLFFLTVVAALLVGFAAGYWYPGREQPMTRSTAGTDIVLTSGGVPASGSYDVPPSTPIEEPPVIPQAEPPPVTVPAAPAAPLAQSRQPEPPSGRLLVRSSPDGASVSVNGESHGVTPRVIRDLAFGTYKVEVSRAGYLPASQQVEISASNTSPSLTFDLKRTGAPAAAPAPARQVFAGSVSIESNPRGAQAYLNGNLVGTTPVVVADVSAGSHVVRIEMGGYRRWTTSVRVVAGQRTRVAASLTPGTEEE
jgi:serine/threonine protein kinase